MKLYFLIAIIFIFLYTHGNLIEPIILSCCGGMNMNRGDYKEGDSEPPKKWKRCFKPNEWNSFPCTNKESSKCCGGKGKCRPTKYGGKCEKDDSNATEKYFIYEGSDEIDYTRDDERKDAIFVSVSNCFKCLPAKGQSEAIYLLFLFLICLAVGVPTFTAKS